MKKLIKIMTSLLVSILCFCCFFGCEKSSGPIPNGSYYIKNQNDCTFIFTEQSIHNTYGWEIKGDNAERWISGMIDYKAKVVEKDSKIYFEGYKFSSETMGEETVYEVKYNKDEKSITLITIEAAGDKDEFLGEFYSLQKAYDKGYIARSDLIIMAELVNSNQVLEVNLLKKQDAENIRNLYSQQGVSYEDIVIKFYGYYNDSAAIILIECGVDVPSIATTTTIEGVVFEFTGFKEILIWRK